MAQRRMFSLDIINSDAFLEMPSTSQVLYFHLGVRADDDGFVTPKMIMRLIGVNDDDLKVLIAKRFILPFDSGVIVIKHWLIHNLIRADMYKETLYKKEKASLGLNDNGAYTELRDGVSEIKVIEPPEWLKRRRGELCTANVPITAPRIGKDRLGKVRSGKSITRSKPVNTTKSFFKLGDSFQEIRTMLVEKIPEQTVDKELNKFISYWTEPNHTGTKVRWQMQKTFDVKRRLRTWLERTQTQTIKKGKGLII